MSRGTPLQPVPAGITAQGLLIEDYAQVVATPLYPQITSSCFSAVHNPTTGLTELVTLGTDGTTVLHFQQHKCSSGDTTWTSSAVPGRSWLQNKTVVSIVAFWDAAAQLQIIINCDNGNGTFTPMWWSYCPPPGDPLGKPVWTGQSVLTEMDAQWLQLGFLQVQSGRCYVYAQGSVVSSPTEYFWCLVAQVEGGREQWRLIYSSYTNGPQEQLAALTILPGSSPAELTFLCATTPPSPGQPGAVTYQPGAVAAGQFQFAPGSSPQPVTLPAGAAATLFVPLQEASGEFLMVSQDAQLYYFSGCTAGASVVQLTGGAQQPASVATVSAGTNSAGEYIVFLLDQPNQNSWILRQQAGGSGVTFGTWVPLGSPSLAISCPGTMNSPGQVLQVTAEQDLQQLSQTADGSWFAVEILGPTKAAAATPPQAQPSYTTQVVVQDANGIPCGNTLVQVVSDRPATLVMNGISYSAGYSTLQVYTNSTGMLTISTAADNLTSPLLTLTVPAITTGAGTCLTRADIASLTDLAGANTAFPITVQTLENAGLIPSSTVNNDPAGAQAMVNSLIAGAQATLNMAIASISPGQAAPAAAAPQYFHFDFTMPGKPRCTELSATDGEALMASFAAQPAGSFLSDIWGDICQFVQTVANTLSSLALSIVNGIITVAATIANEVQQFVMSTIPQAGALLEVMLGEISGLIGAVLGPAIDWLMNLFDWNDIADTKTVVDYYIGQVFAEIQVVDAAAQAYIQSQFAALQTEIQSAFAQLGSNNSPLSPGLTFAQAAGANTISEAQGGQATYSANSVQCNYVLNKALDYFDSHPEKNISPAPGNAYSALFGIQTALGSAGFKEQAAGVLSWLDSFSPDQFLNQAVEGVLAALEQAVLFVLEMLEEAIVGILQVLAESAASLQQAMSEPIDIPVISWILENFCGVQLPSLQDVCSLLLAAPLTILFKLANSGAAPFSNPAQYMLSPMIWPVFPSSSTATESKGFGESLPKQIQNDFAKFSVELGGISGFMEILTDVIAVASSRTNIVNPSDAPAPAPKRQSAISAAALVIDMFAQIASMPLKDIEDRINGKSTSLQNWKVGMWSAQWAPVFFDLVFTGASSVRGLMKFSEEGCWFSTVCGLGLTAGGVAYLVQPGSDPNDAWGNLISNLPLIPKPLLRLKSAPAIGGVLALDAICAIAALILQSRQPSSAEPATA